MAESDPVQGGLELRVLGAGPAYSDVPGDLGASYLVSGDGQALVLDLGQGTFNPLAIAVEPSSLLAVAISHLHPDHFIDLIALRHYLCRREFQPSRRLRVISPLGLERRLDAAYDQPGFSAAAFDVEPPPTVEPPPMVERPPMRGPLILGPFSLEARRVEHSGESVGYRVALAGRPGAGIVYSGDIAAPDDLLPLIRPGDVLLVEASFGPGPVPEGMPHIDAPMAARLAREGRAGRLVLVHLRMGSDREATLEAAGREFAGPIAIGRPGDVMHA